MMTNQKIKQQEAAIEMLKFKVKAKRIRPEVLEAAVNELNRLRAELTDATPSDQAPARSMSRAVQAIQKDVDSDIFALKHSALSHEAARLRRDQAELSNMLHKVPPGHACPELVDRIMELHYQIEDIWDKKKFLDRNQTDGPAKPDHDQQVTTRTVDAVETKSELTVKIQQLREKRSKLIAKLKNPKASAKKISDWEIEMAKVNAGIDEATEKRSLL